MTGDKSRDVGEVGQDRSPRSTYGLVVKSDRLREQMRMRGLTTTGLARLARISPTTVSHALRGRPIHPHKLRAIAAALADVEPCPALEALAEVAR